MNGISRSRGWDKEIPHGVSPMEQLVLSDKWARKCPLVLIFQIWDRPLGFLLWRGAVFFQQLKTIFLAFIF